MKIIGKNKVTITDKKNIIFYLGRDFELETTNLLNILPNLQVEAKIINKSNLNLEAIYEYYILESNFIDLDSSYNYDCNYIFLGTGKENIEDIKNIIEKSNYDNSKYYILIRNKNIEDYRDIFDIRNLYIVLLDTLKEEKPIMVQGILGEENPFVYSDIYNISIAYNNYYGDALAVLLRLPANCKGSLYEYFNNKLFMEKEKFERIKGNKIPSKATENAWKFFNSRKLLTKEDIEKRIFEGDFEGVETLINQLISEDYNQFFYIYELIKYLDGKMPADSLIGIVKNTLEAYRESLDDMYFPILYHKVSNLLRSKGDYLASSNWLRQFNLSEALRERLPNNRINFLCDEVEGYLFSNSYKEIFDLENQEIKTYYQIEDMDEEENKNYDSKKEKLLNLLALSYNQTKDYRLGKELIKNKKLCFPEVLILEEILSLNLGEAEASRLTEKQMILEGSDRYDLELYLDFIKIINNIKKNQQIDNIKITNQLVDKINKLTEIEKDNNKKKKDYSFILSLALLYKARALRQNGSFKEAVAAYEAICNKFYRTLNSKIKSLVLTGYVEKALLNKDLNNYSEAIDVISKGEKYIIESHLLNYKNLNSKYDFGNQIRLQLAKFETELYLNYINLTKIEEIKALIKSYEDKYPQDNEGYRLKLNSLLLKKELFDNKVEEGIKLTEESLEYCRKNNNLSNQKILAEILLMMKNKLLKNLDQESDKGHYVKFLEEIISRYLKHEDEKLNILGAISLKNLAEFYLKEENNGGAEEVADKFLKEYSGSNNEKIKRITDYFKITKAQLLSDKKEYKAAKEIAQGIDKNRDSEIVKKREFLIAQCDYQLMNINECISEYEYYLSRFGARCEEEVKEDIYWKLVTLFLKIDNKAKTIEYLDKIISVSQVNEKELEAYLIKGDILLEYDKEGAYATYFEGINKFYTKNDIGIQSYLIKIYSRAAAYISSEEDLKVLKEVVENCVASFDLLTEETKNDLFLTCKNIAWQMEKEELKEEEKFFRSLEQEYFHSLLGLEYEREIAENYYRLLILSIEDRDTEKKDSYFKIFYEYLDNKQEPLLLEYFNTGTIKYVEDLYKIGEYDKVKEVLEKFLLKNSDITGIYYKGKVLSKAGSNKEALESFNKVIELGTDEIYFDSILEKIAILKSEKSFMNRSVKKLISEIKGEYLEKIRSMAEKYMVVALLYNLGELYEVIGKENKAKKIYREAIKEYGNDSDIKIVEELKRHYEKLNTT